MSDSSTWQEFFDSHAPVYEENAFTRNTVAEVDFLLEELAVPEGGTILDVGCGTGRHSVELAKRGYDVTGVDLSAQMLARGAENARAAGVEVVWIQADAADFSVGSRFDAAIGLCEGAFGLLGAGDDAIAQPAAILRNVSRSVRPEAKVLFTVLNGAAMIRKYEVADIERGRFDPLTMVEVSDYAPREGLPTLRVRERAFVPTELVVLFALAGLRVQNIWGGTAGNWGRRSIDPDEIEIMVVARKVSEAWPSAEAEWEL